MIHFLCPELPHPSGGLRVLYRHVDVLNAHGLSAAIVHQRPGFRASWFANTTPILHPPLEIGPEDILVFTELEGPAIAEQAKGIRKVIYNQTPYYMFRGYPLDMHNRQTPYTSKDVVAAVVVSEDGRDYLQHVFPDLRVYRIRNSIDPRFHPPERPKRKQICFMPRKHPEDAQQVLSILKFRNALGEFKVIPIQNRPEEEVISIMRESMIFLSFGYPEGFGLPPAEAMACGCIAIGYHGNGGREYLTAGHGFPIEIGDIIGFSKAVEHVLGTVSKNPLAFDELTRRASDFIHSTYSPENERNSIIACWRSILGQT
jgi:glycosyltransferase involved in cell wall biosynthesis